jgi:hypothetical protein
MHWDLQSCRGHGDLCEPKELDATGWKHPFRLQQSVVHDHRLSRILNMNSSNTAGGSAKVAANSSLVGPPWRDDEGRSPWLGRFRHYEEYLKADLPAWEDPTQGIPEEDLLVDGINGAEGIRTQFRLGRELWLEGHGYLYREALSCMTSTMNARMRAALQYMNEFMAVESNARIYMTEQVTPLFDLMSTRFPNLTGSEFLPGETLGSVKDGIRCEDLSRLTFDDEQFDLVISFDVLEHVPDYHAALREIVRVLKPGGRLLMTAPITLKSYKSTVRARIIDDGTLVHICPPEYHGNPLGPPSLCFTSFGFDLIEDMRYSGFLDAYAELYANKQLGYWGEPQPLLIGHK